MPSNRVAVSYQDLCSKELISDLKQAAICDVKTVCRLPCNRCPNVCSTIDLEKIAVVGLQLDHVVIKQTEETDNLYLHLSADNIFAWLRKNDIAYQNILN